MTLTTHALVGAAAAAVVPAHPVLAFTVGFVSHFVADAIPHKDYGEVFVSLKESGNKLESDFVMNKGFIRDFAIIAGDGLLGYILSIALFSVLLPVDPLIVLVGAFGGQFPDALQFLYFKTRSKILEPLQKFHIWIQQKSPIGVSLLTAIGLQCVMFLVVYALVYLTY